MPIKPENKRRYPADWPEIRERVLQRSGYRCEHPGCAARQYAVGRWMRDGGLFSWDELSPPATTYLASKVLAAEWFFALGEEGPRPIVIVLTVAHLDHKPENCDDDNLRALCQRHHLAHDHAHHMANAQATRRAKSGTAELF